MTKFIIVRHGQSEANLKEIYAGRYDTKLTDVGREQAERVCDYVLKTYQADAVYASPLSRTRETVRKIAEKSGAPFEVCDGVAEIFGGEWEGKTIFEIAEKYPTDALLWRDDIGNSRPTGGENFQEVQARADGALKEIARIHSDGTVVVCTHGGVIRALQCLFEHQPIGYMKDIDWVPNASISEVNYKDGEYKIVKMGKTEHLNGLVTTLKNL